MSQPPQNGWGPSDPQGQPGPDGYGQDQGSYGQPSPNAGYGQDQPGYGQGSYGQPSPNAGYGGYDQNQGSYEQGQGQGGYGQPSPNSGYGPSFGQDGAYGADVQQGQKKPGSKLPLLICAGCAVIVLVLGLLGGGIFLLTRNGDETAGGTQTTEPGGDETTEPGGDETTEPGGDETTEPGGDETTEPGGDETTEPAGEGSGDKGTRENPYAAGEKFTLPDGEKGELEISFGKVNWDATDEVKQANQFNDPPGEGNVYVTVPITVVYHGPDKASAIMLLKTSYVADTGNAYSTASVVTENSSVSQNEVYDGGTLTFDEPFEIPADTVKKGAFTTSVLLDFGGKEVWVKAE